MSEYNSAKSRTPSVVVTGASGLIGRRLLPLLNNLKTTAIINKYDKALPVDNVISADLKNKNEVKNIFSNIKPDIIFHFAAFSDRKYYVDLTSPPYNSRNVEILRASFLTMTENILDHISPDTHIIFPSTDKVFNGTDPYPNENSPTNPEWMRAKFKVDCENLIIDRFTKYHILRVSMVHGIGSVESHSFIDKAIIDIKKKQLTKAYSNVYRCYILHSELSNLLYSLINDEHFGIYNVGSEMESYYQRICKVCREKIFHLKNISNRLKGTLVQCHRILIQQKLGIRLI